MHGADRPAMPRPLGAAQRARVADSAWPERSAGKSVPTCWNGDSKLARESKNALRLRSVPPRGLTTAPTESGSKFLFPSRGPRASRLNLLEKRMRHRPPRRCLTPFFRLKLITSGKVFYHALRRRRSSPAPISRPESSALLGSGMAVQVSVVPLMVNEP